MRCIRYGATACVILIGAQLPVQAQTGSDSSNPAPSDMPVLIKEKDRRAPVDYGFGPGVKAPTTSSLRLMAAAVAPNAAPAGGAAAHTAGVFGPAFSWPLIPLHAVLLPDGRVMSYGTDDRGQQGAQLIYDVWDPQQGTGASSHLTLPNSTATDIFCSAQTVLATTGEVLIIGGDATINGQRNYSNELTEIFDPSTNTLRPNTGMSYARWYPSAISLANGDVAVLGGRQDFDIDAPTPEVFSATGGWRTLSGATSVPALGFPYGNWYYPKAFVTPFGTIFVLGNDGRTFSLTTSASGTITQLPPVAPPGDYQLPSMMFAPGKVLSLRASGRVSVVNLNTQPPRISATANIDQVRYWSNATVLADGKVMVNGGSSVSNELSGVAYTAQLWSPGNGAWTTGAAASKPRLYHSIALLLPDASVLTAAGGAPGPVNNLNAEIYYPPYLYKKDGSGQPATRPSIVAAPEVVRVGQSFSITVNGTGKVGKVTMVRSGSVTHSFNADQRFLPLSFTQTGQQLAVSVPTDPDVALPGSYMLFVFRNGVPSIAKIVRVMP